MVLSFCWFKEQLSTLGICGLKNNEEISLFETLHIFKVVGASNLISSVDF
jgi:hypothetical protein